jgi:hypothetical protein
MERDEGSKRVFISVHIKGQRQVSIGAIYSLPCYEQFTNGNNDREYGPRKITG